MYFSLYRPLSCSSARQILCLYVLIFAAGKSSALPDICHSEDCGKSSSSNADWALLQAAHRVARLSQPGTSKLVQKVSKVGLNPSGAAAPLNEEGYSAVADRCCQAEMQVFIRRHMSDLNLEVCDDAGLLGIVPYHSCEKGPQNFAKLTSDLLQDSIVRCTWLAERLPNTTYANESCIPPPEDCPTYAGALPDADCGCNRTIAARFDLTTAQITQSNLGGIGPDSGAAEFRITNAGVSHKGEPFDLVITNISEYNAKYPHYNGLYGFGVINIGPPGMVDENGVPTDFPGKVDFQFSFFEAGTSTPLQLAEIHLSLFDLDGRTEDWGIEFASSKGYSGYVTDMTPDLSASRLPDGRTQFVGSGSANNLANPRSPESLTEEQRKNSVMYFFQNVSSFELTFGVEQAPSWSSAGSGRYMFFSGTSALNDRCGE